MASMFRSLAGHNFRVWSAGAFVSNIGTWMQRTAQDWLVLTQLTHNNATAVGWVMALQYGPQIFLLPWSGFAADHFDRRKLLIATQAAQGALAGGLGVLIVTHLVQLWQVYIFAGLLGCVTAFDAPARQTFVTDLVGDEDLSNAVALNSTSFNAARMIGPAVAGFLIAGVGTGMVFVINGASFIAVLCSLVRLRTSELRPSPKATRTRGSLAEGLRYVWLRPDLRAMLFMLFFIGTFGLNFSIFISTMCVSIFHAGVGQFGFLSSILAIGSVFGALWGAKRARSSFRHVCGGATIFGVGLTLAALAPDYALFGLALIIVGAASLTFTNSTNALMQLTTDPVMRGRVMALRITVALGGTPIGAPIAGWVADRYGPRWALGIGAASGFVAGLLALHYFIRFRGLRIVWEGRRLRFRVADATIKLQ